MADIADPESQKAPKRQGSVANQGNPKGSKFDDYKAKAENASMDSVFTCMKIFQTISAVLLIFSGTARFFQQKEFRSWTLFLLMIYFIVFAFVLLSMEYP